MLDMSKMFLVAKPMSKIVSSCNISIRWGFCEDHFGLGKTFVLSAPC